MDGPLTSFFVDRNYTKEKNKRPKGVKKGVCDFISCNHLKADLLNPISSTAEPFLEEINGIFIIN
jgi:hypothetical protein